MTIYFVSSRARPLATLALAAVAISYSKSQSHENDFIDLSIVRVCGSSDILTLLQIVIRTESTESKNSHFDHIEYGYIIQRARFFSTKKKQTIKNVIKFILMVIFLPHNRNLSILFCWFLSKNRIDSFAFGFEQINCSSLCL